MNLDRFCNPTTLDEFRATWMIKSWAQFIVKAKFKKYYVSNKEDMQQLYNSLIYWVMYAGNDTMLQTFENASHFIADHLHIYDATTIAELYNNDNWDMLLDNGYYIPVTYTSRPQYNKVVKDTFVPANIDIYPDPIPEININETDNNVYTAGTDSIQSVIKFTDEDELPDDSDEWFTGTRQKGTRAPHECDTEKKNKWLNKTDNTIFIDPEKLKYFSTNWDEYVVVYEANANAPIKTIQISNICGYKCVKNLNILQENGLYNAIRVLYAKTYNVNTPDVRILTAQMYMTTRHNRINKLYRNINQLN